MGNFFTEVFNNVFFLSSVLMTYVCYRRYRQHGKKWVYILFIAGLALCFTSVAVRIGWWSAGLKYAPVGSDYHPFFTEWKWLPTGLASIAFASGVAMLVGFIEELNRDKMIGIVATIICAAFVFGVM